MKKIGFYALLLLMVLGMGMLCHAEPAAMISEHAAKVLSQEDASMLEDVLSGYAALRASSFAGERSLMASDSRFCELAAEEADRCTTIKEKNMSIGIEVLSADTDMQVNGATYDENGLIKIDVYEWTDFSYDDLTNDVVGEDEAGIGVYHVMLVDPETGKILRDAYDEGPATGVASSDYMEMFGDPLWVRQSKLSEQIEEEESDRTLMYTRYAGYNPDACVAYADSYVYHGAAGGRNYENYYNGAYTNFNPYGGDCANYTSQSINAGGMPQVSCNTYGTSGWFYVNSGNRSATWTGAPQLRTWMANNRGQVVNGPADSQVFKGSPCFYDWANGGASYDHATICVGTNSAGRAIINSHNYDYYHYVFNYGGYVSTVQLTATNTSDKTPPTISHVRIASMTEDSFIIACQADDNVGVTQVQFATWTQAGEQDDIIWHVGERVGSLAYYTIKKSEHKNEAGPYHIHIYAHDGAGNTAKKELSDIVMTNTVGKKTLPDGDYFIQAMCADKTKLLTINGNSSANSANVHIWESAFDAEHVWRVQYKGDGKYEIYSAKLGTSMDVASGSLGMSANLQTFERNNSDAQRWILEQTESGDYNVVSYRSGLVWDVNHGATENGTNVSLWIEDGTKNQVFRFIPVPTANDKVLPDGLYQFLLPENNNQLMAVEGASKENRAHMVLETSHKNKSAVFKLEYLDNGCYFITNENSGLVMDVFGMLNTANVPVEQGKGNGGFNQQWLIRDAGDGTYTIMSRNAGLYLAPQDGTTENGTTITLQTKADAKWKIVPYAFYVRYNLNGGEGTVAEGSATIGGTVAVTDKIPTRIAHDFLGWATTQTATTPTHSAGASVSGTDDLTLYAVWKPYPLTVTKKASEGYTTTLYNIDANTRFIIAQYKQGVLLATTTRTAENAIQNFTPAVGTDEIKVMVWDSVKGLTPIKEAEYLTAE